MAWWGPLGPRLIESHLSRDVPGYPETSHGLVGASGPRLIESHLSRVLGCPGISRDVPMAWWGPSGPRLIESHLSRDVPGYPETSHGLVGALRSQAY